MTHKRSLYGWIVLTGALVGSLITLVDWVQLWTSTRFPHWLYQSLIGSGVFAIVGYGIYLRRNHPRLSRAWVFATVLFAISLVYLFPQTLDPGCGGIPLAFAHWENRHCTTVCDSYGCTWWQAYPCSLCSAADYAAGKCVGCCFTYGCTASHQNCSDDPPTVSGSFSCATPGSGGWCRGGASLDMTASDPQGYATTISGTLGGASFSCAVGSSCSQSIPDSSGTASFSATASGGGNLSSSAGSASYQVDSAAPSFALTTSGTSGAGGWFTSAVQVDSGAADATSGLASVQYSIDGGALQSGSKATISTDGTHTVSFQATDVAGNTATTSTTVNVDVTPPAITINLPALNGSNGWFISGPVTAAASATDATSGLDPAGWQSSVDGGAPQPGSTIQITGDGAHTVAFSAHDLAGNLGSATQTVKIDTTPPVAGFSLPAPDGQNGWYKSPVTVDAVGTDATSGVASKLVSLDKGNWSPSLTISTDGVYTVYSQATDNAGNTATATTTVKLDTTAPTVSVAPPQATSGWYNTQPSVSVAASDATSGVATTEYSLDGGSWQTSLATITDGTHSFQVRVADHAGNSTISGPYSLQVDMSPPQSVFVSPAEGSTVVAVGIFTLSGTTSDVTSGVAGAQISLDSGTTWSPLTVAGENWSFAWDTGKVANGIHEVYVRGVDVAGNIEHTAHITVTVANQGPDVSITKDWVIWQMAQVKITKHVLPVVGAHITISHVNGYAVRSFDYSASSLPSDFKWDGFTSKGTRAPAGLYTVRVEIWDGYGHHTSDSGTVWIPLPLPRATKTPMPSSTPGSATTPTQQQMVAAVILPATLAVQVVVPEPKPVTMPVKKIETPVIQRILWPAFAFIGLLAVLAAASLSDRRPRELRALAKSLETTREIQKSYPSED